MGTQYLSPSVTILFFIHLVPASSKNVWSRILVSPLSTSQAPLQETETTEEELMATTLKLLTPYVRL